MDYKIDSVSAYEAMLNDILESYRLSGRTSHDLMVWRPRAQHRRVNLTGLLDELLQQEQIHFICPVCEGYLEVKRESKKRVRFEQSWLMSLLPRGRRTHMICSLCRFTVESRKPLVDALADLAQELDRCRREGGLLSWTRKRLEEQYDAWLKKIQDEPPLLKRTLYQPFVPFAGKQLENREQAMELAAKRLHEPESIGFDYAVIQIALSGFRGRNASHRDNLFTYLEREGVTDAYGSMNESLLRKRIETLGRAQIL